MKRNQTILLISATLALLFASVALGQAPSLGTAANFGVLGGTTVTNTGPTTVRGDLGVSPGTAVTGFAAIDAGPGLITGTFHIADGVAGTAQTDAGNAYGILAGLPCSGANVLTGQDLGGKVLPPGVYCFASSAQLTGTLILDAQGNPNAQFIFQMGSTLTTASNSIVSVINSGSNCNVYWQVGSSATIGTATVFAGNILALASVTATTGASVSGRLIALNGAVTLDSNNVAVCPLCTPITLDRAALPNGTILTPYNELITASGGTAPYAFTLLSGALPPGLTLADVPPNQVRISGTPTTAGSYTFTIKATDAAGCFGSHLYTIVISAAGCVAPPSLAPLTIPATTAGTLVNQTITVSGGTPPYTISAAPAPAGLTFTVSGTTVGISGTARYGSYNFTITATDALGCVVSQVYTLLVNCPPIVIAATPIPNGSLGLLYGVVNITASGGTAPYTYSVTGTLPPGMTLSAGGALTGTPTATGTYPFRITATDAAGCSGVRPFSMVITVAPLGGPTLDSYGLAILIMLLAAGGAFLVNRLRM